MLTSGAAGCCCITGAAWIVGDEVVPIVASGGLTAALSGDRCTVGRSPSPFVGGDDTSGDPEDTCRCTEFVANVASGCAGAIGVDGDESACRCTATSPAAAGDVTALSGSGDRCRGDDSLGVMPAVAGSAIVGDGTGCRCMAGLSAVVGAHSTSPCPVETGADTGAAGDRCTVGRAASLLGVGEVPATAVGDA